MRLICSEADRRFVWLPVGADPTIATAHAHGLLKPHPAARRCMGAVADRVRLRPAFETPPVVYGPGLVAAPRLAEPAWRVAETDLESARGFRHPGGERATGIGGGSCAQPDRTALGQTERGGRVNGPETFTGPPDDGPTVFAAAPARVTLARGRARFPDVDPGEHLPGSTVHTFLSHDVVAHATADAILAGMHRRCEELSNPGVLASHEGFADLVTRTRPFALPEIVERELARKRGALVAETTLGNLAVGFGRGAVGRRSTMSEAIGSFDDAGVWHRLTPDPAAYKRSLEPHARGANLVAAVLDASLVTYQARSTELIRLATEGSGVLPAGAPHPTPLKRLADEAAKSAHHVSRLAIRALDDLPPVDETFGELLRALVTAYYDLVPKNRYSHRVAFLESFRRCGLVLRDLPTLSVDTLRWNGAVLVGAKYPWSM